LPAAHARLRGHDTVTGGEGGCLHFDAETPFSHGEYAPPSTSTLSAVGAGVEHILQRGLFRCLQVQVPAVFGVDPPLRIGAAGAGARRLPCRWILVSLAPVDAGGHRDQLRAVEIVGKGLSLFRTPTARTGTPRLGQRYDVIDIDSGGGVGGDTVVVAVPCTGCNGAVPAMGVGVPLKHHMARIASVSLIDPVRKLVA